MHLTVTSLNAPAVSFSTAHARLAIACTMTLPVATLAVAKLPALAVETTANGSSPFPLAGRQWWLPFPTAQQAVQ
jgi:hypothetical protein